MFMPNMEPKGLFGLQVMIEVTKVLEDCFEVKFIRWVISCSEELSWILLSLSKHVFERVQYFFAVAIYVGTGQSDEVSFEYNKRLSDSPSDVEEFSRSEEP